MGSATQQWMQGSLELLASQRERYALAERASRSADSRERHRRNVDRLDQEIETLSDALYSVSTDKAEAAAAPPPAHRVQPMPSSRQFSVADVVLTGPYASLAEGSGPNEWAALLFWVTAAFVVGFIAIAVMV